MAKNLTLVFANLFAFSGFADQIQVPNTLELSYPTQKNISQNPQISVVKPFTMTETSESQIIDKGSIYLRALTDSESSQINQILPGLGFGYRRSIKNAAIDISINYSFV